jgi:lipoate-protein ligase A
MKTLRFIDDPARDGELNMAIDDLLAHQAGNSGAPIVFRLYSWSHPTLSCGFHQRVEQRVNLESCRLNKVDLVRRPTGGRELLHDGDLSFSITGHTNSNVPDKLETKDFFFKMGRIVIKGLEALGIKASLANGTRKMNKSSRQPCLAALSQYEVVSDGKKIVPMARRVYPGSVLIHGSMPLVKPKIPTARLLKIEDELLLQRQIDKSSTTLFQILGKEVEVERLKKSLFLSFKDIFKGSVGCYGILRRELTEATKKSFNWTIKNVNQCS